MGKKPGSLLQSIFWFKDLDFFSSWLVHCSLGNREIAVNSIGGLRRHFCLQFATSNISTTVLRSLGRFFGPLNPLNAELNPICLLLVLLGDLTFMGPCIVSIFQYTCISDKIQRYTVYLYL
jgi:hypothetical protein